MKKKLYSILLGVILVLSIIGLVACGETNDDGGGGLPDKPTTYYAYDAEGNKIDDSRITIDENSWSADGMSGTIVGENGKYTLYINQDGQDVEIATATIQNGVLTINSGDDQVVLYYADGKYVYDPDKNKNDEIEVTYIVDDVYGDVIKHSRNRMAENWTPQYYIKGYDFVGWYIDKERIKPFDFNTRVEKELTLFAKFQDHLEEGQLQRPQLDINNQFIRWNDVENANGYKIIVKYDINSDEILYSQDTNETQFCYIDLELDSNYGPGEYYFLVLAKGNGRDTKDSNFANILFKYRILSTPKISYNEDNDFIQWTNVENAESYEVSIDDMYWDISQTISYADVSTLDAGEHTVDVRAWREGWASTSSYDKEKEPFTFTKNTLATPTSFYTYLDSENNGYRFSWNNVNYADEYKIYVDGELFTTVTETTFLYYYDMWTSENPEQVVCVTAAARNNKYKESSRSQELTIKRGNRITVLVNKQNAGSLEVWGSCTPDEFGNIYLLENDNVNLYANTNGGYIFVGWFCDDELVTREQSLSLDGAKEATYMAKWSEVAFEVNNFEAGELSERDNGRTYIFGDMINCQAYTKGEGYVFVGWFLGDELITSNTWLNIPVPEEDTTYLAKWRVLTVLSSDENAGTAYRLGGFDGEGVTINANAKEGYIFEGWYIGDQLVSKNAFYTVTMRDEDLTIVAKWMVCPVTVEKNNEDAGTITTSENPRLGENYSIRANTNSGYTFVGWYIGDTLVSANNEYSFLLTENPVTYTAKWCKLTLKVGEKCEDLGYISSGLMRSYNAKEEVIIKTRTYDASNTFMGWYEGDTFISDAWDLKINMPSVDTTYTAKWTKISLKKDVGTNSTSHISTSWELDESKQNVTIITSSSGGLVFIGWFLGDTKVTDDFTYNFAYEEGTHEYTAKYCMVKVEGGSIYSNVGGYVDALQTNLKAGDSTTITANTYQGYTFIGWFVGDEKFCSELSYNITMTDKDITYTAKWSKVSINCDKERGSVGGLDDEYKVGDITTITASTNTGYTFVGWFVGDEKVSSELSYDITMTDEDITYTAKWSKATIEVDNTSVGFAVVEEIIDDSSYSVQNGVLRGRYVVGDRATITTTAYNDFVFVGWFLGDERVSTELTHMLTMTDEDVTYTAKWIQSPITLTKNKENCYVIKDQRFIEGEDFTIKAGANSDYYMFVGWFNGENMVTSEAVYTFKATNQPITLMAKWCTFNYSVDAPYVYGIGNAGKCEWISGERIIGETIKLKATTILLGYDFLGWFKDDVLFTTDECLEVVVTSEDVNYIAKWETSEDVANFTFNTTANSFTITGVKDKTVTNIVLPDYTTSIGNSAFSDCSSLASITIPNSVTSIGNSAFSDCSSLASITIPNSVTALGLDLFTGCSSLENLTLPFIVSQDVTTASVKTLFGYYFGNRSYNGGVNIKQYYNNFYSVNYYIPSTLKNVTINGGNILYGTFYGCSSLSNVTFGDDVKIIGAYAFNGCSGLVSITIPNSVTSIGNYAFANCSDLSSVMLGDKVESIGAYAFNGCSGLVSITIPNSVTSIGNSAFANCSDLSSVTLGDNVESIGNSAFYECISLESITLPSGISSIEHNTFYGCSLTSIVIPDNVTSIGYYAFYGCGRLASIVLPSNVTFTSASNGETKHFYGCPIKYATVPTNAISYFDKSLLKTVVINGEGSIGNYAFNGCSGLESVVIGDSVTSIGGSAFSSCSSLESVTIGSGVTSIESSAFYNCSSLESVVIGDSVTSIGDSAFYNCYKLVEVINKSNLTITVGSNYYGYIGYYAKQVLTEAPAISNFIEENGYTFYNDNGTYYLIGYKGTDTSLQLPNNINGHSYDINQYAFYGCSDLESVTVSNNVTSIGNYAFNGCSGLESVVIGDSVISIGNYAFSSCNSLESVVIGDSVTSIGNYAFNYCYKLIEVINKSNLDITAGNSYYGYIGYYAKQVLTEVPATSNFIERDDYTFYNANGTYYLIEYKGTDTSLQLPNNINGHSYDINQYAFYTCQNLTSIVMPNSITSIGNSAFSGCSSLVSIIIPNSVTSIGSNAFYGCNNLQYNEYDNGLYLGNETNEYLCLIKAKTTAITSCSINNACKVIYYRAFYYCRNLTSIEIPNSVTSIGAQAFDGCSIQYATVPTSAISKFDKSHLKTVVIIGGERIGNSAFSSCSSLESVVIGDSVTSIGNTAFSYCSSLVSVTIGSGVTSIESNAFYNCYKLVEVINKSNLDITVGNSYYGDIGYYAKQVLTKTPAISNFIEENGYIFYNANGTYYLTGYNGASLDLVLPSDINGHNYGINQYAFYNCQNLTSIVMPNSITSIGNNAFHGCSKLTSIEIPNSVTSIGSDSFYGCNNLQYSEYDNGLYLGNETNEYLCLIKAKTTAITSCSINNACKVISSGAFNGCRNLTSIVIPNSVTSIGASAFNGCSVLESVTIPNSVTSIGSSAFYNCKNLTSIVIPNSVTSIGEYAFKNCSCLTSIVIPNGVTSIEFSTFYGCSALESVTIPNSVTSIESSAFYDCYKLVEVINKSNLDITVGSSDYGYIGYYAKQVLAETPAISNFIEENGYTFYNANGTYYLTGYNGASLDLVLPSDINGHNYGINQYAFYNCSSLKSISLPSNITIIEDGTFYNCSSLRNFVIPNGVTSIGNYAFYNCSYLRILQMPASVTTIGDSALYNCSELQYLYYADGTMEDWDAIVKGDQWNYSARRFEVVLVVTVL